MTAGGEGRVVVCDDDPGNLLILGRILREEGFEVSAVSSGLEVLEGLPEEPELS